MRIIVRLKREHRITIDKTRASGRIDVDGQTLFKGWWSFNDQHQFSIEDGDRHVPASISIETSGVGVVTRVILVIDGATVYDSLSSVAPQPWRKHVVVTKATPIGQKTMLIVLQLENEHTVYIDNSPDLPFRCGIDIDGQVALRTYNIIGEHDLVIKDGNRRVSASIATDLSVFNNLTKVVLTVDGAIVYQS